MEKKRVYRAFMLLLLFVLYYGAVVGYSHTHMTESGPITHSHPYSSPTHSHGSMAMLEYSSIMTTLLMVLVTAYVALGLFAQKIFGFGFKYHHLTKQYIHFSRPSRAPPVY